MQIIIAGAGGTGGWFIPQIVKYLSTLNLNATLPIFIYDFDHVELKNLTRQNFIKSDISRNKAHVLASRYSKIASKFVTVSGFAKAFPDNNYYFTETTIVFSCVDTIKARQETFDKLLKTSSITGRNILLIDSGNSLDSGQVTATVFNGKTSEFYASQTYLDILANKGTDVSKNENTLSCADVEQQTYYINQMQANNMLQFMQYLSVQSQIGTDELGAANILSIEKHFDNLTKRIKNNKVNSIVETGVITTYDKEFTKIEGVENGNNY